MRSKPKSCSLCPSSYFFCPSRLLGQRQQKNKGEGLKLVVNTLLFGKGPKITTGWPLWLLCYNYEQRFKKEYKNQFKMD